MKKSVHLLLLILIINMNLFSEESAERPSIGLCLSGGGALGFIHVGVIKALEELRVPIDSIAGTSMGGIVGGLYAQGMSIEEIESFCLDSRWDQLFIYKSDNRPMTLKNREYINSYFSLTQGIHATGGIFDTGSVFSLLKTLVGDSHYEDFDDIPIPFRTEMTDLNTGKAVVIDKGDLTKAMIATMSVPGVFMPTSFNGEMFMDGAVLNSLPIDILRDDLNADFVIAISVLFPLKKIDNTTSTVDILNQLTIILQETNALDNLEMADFYLRNENQDYDYLDFDNARELIDYGYTHMMANSKDISHLSLTPQEYSEYKDNIRIRSRHSRKNSVKVDFIHYSGVKNVNQNRLNYYTDPLQGKVLTPEDIRELLVCLNGVNGVRSVNYQFFEQNGRQGLLLEVEEEQVLDHFFYLGGSLYRNKSETQYQVQGSYRMENIGGVDASLETTLMAGARNYFSGALNVPLTHSFHWRPAMRLYYGETSRSISEEGEYQYWNYPDKFWNLSGEGGMELVYYQGLNVQAGLQGDYIFDLNKSSDPTHWFRSQAEMYYNSRKKTLLNAPGAVFKAQYAYYFSPFLKDFSTLYVLHENKITFWKSISFFYGAKYWHFFNEASLFRNEHMYNSRFSIGGKEWLAAKSPGDIDTMGSAGYVFKGGFSWDTIFFSVIDFSSYFSVQAGAVDFNPLDWGGTAGFYFSNSFGVLDVSVSADLAGQWDLELVLGKTLNVER